MPNPSLSPLKEAVIQAEDALRLAPEGASPRVAGPVIQLPFIGEFTCRFGEVTPRGDVVLHHDDFCMK